MSGRHSSGSRYSYSSEPIVIERSPQVRESYRIIRSTRPKKERLTFGSKLYNLFRSRKKRIHIIEESPVRSRRQQRQGRTRTPSPSPSPPPPPSPPRGPYRRMTTRLDDDDYFAPLPPRIPPESRHKYPEDDPIGYIIEEREPQRYRKVKIRRQDDVHDDEAHPRLERPSTAQSKRDSGKYYVQAHHDNRPSSAWVEHERHRGDDEVRRLTANFSDLLAKETKRRVEAERAVTAAEDEAYRLKNDLEHEKRKQSLEARERAVAERQRRLDEEARNFVEVRRPVIVHNPQPGTNVSNRVPANSALDRAQADYRRRVQVERPQREERRPVTAEGIRPRRQSVIIVDDPLSRGGDRPRR